MEKIVIESGAVSQLEDILEELVGEIWDEHDEATEDFRRQSDGSWIVLGSAGVDDLYERLGLPEDEDIDSNTVNGLVQEKNLPSAQGGRPVHAGRVRRCRYPHGQAPRDRGAPDPGGKAGTEEGRRRKAALQPADQ